MPPKQKPANAHAYFIPDRNFSFDLSPSNGITLYWSLHAEELVPDESEGAEEGATVSQPGATLMEGNLSFPQSSYDAWGTDDSVVTDWAMTELGFTQVTSE